MPEPRAQAFSRLFEAVHEGVYIGTLGPDATATIAANPHLKLIFGYPGEAPEADVRPFDRDRFVDPQARVALIERLSNDGAVVDYLLRLRRADSSAVWVELTARADPPASEGSSGSRRSSGTSASARSSTTRRATSITSCCRPRRWRRSARPSRASPTS